MSKPNVLDHTQDLSGVDQHRLISLFPPPDFVKQASHEQLYGDTETLPPHVYAYEAKRAYPCHQKAATWMSAAFFADKRASLPADLVPHIEARILKSAAYWNIKPEVEALWAKMAETQTEKQANLLDSQFALVWNEAGRKERHYPLRNMHEVKMASDWFGKFHTEFTFADKHTIATKILMKAAEFLAPVENAELLHKCAGYGYCANVDAADAWAVRASLVQRRFPDHAKEAMALATNLKNTEISSRDHGVRVKMATLMDQFDRQTELHRLYDDGGLSRPEDVLFMVTEKVASDFVNSHVQTTTGAVYEKSALAALDLNMISTWLGSELAEACGPLELDLEKLAAIVPTLPRPDAQMFERMALSAGVPVAAREKEAAATGFTFQELESYAAAYGQTDALRPV
jgi:hypothetical protein